MIQEVDRNKVIEILNTSGNTDAILFLRQNYGLSLIDTNDIIKGIKRDISDKMKLDSIGEKIFFFGLVLSGVQKEEANSRIAYLKTLPSPFEP